MFVVVVGCCLLYVVICMFVVDPCLLVVIGFDSQETTFGSRCFKKHQQIDTLVCECMWYLDLFLTLLRACFLLSRTQKSQKQIYISHTIDLFVFSSSCPMLEVLSAVTGKSIAVFEEVDFAERSVKALNRHLAQKIGIPGFRLRLLQDNCPLDDDQTLIDDQTLTLQVVQLVILNVLPPDREQDRRIMVACEENDDKFLEQNLNQPRDPNFEDASQVTLLYAAASNGHLRYAICIIL